MDNWWITGGNDVENSKNVKLFFLALIDAIDFLKIKHVENKLIALDYSTSKKLSTNYPPVIHQLSTNEQRSTESIY